MLLKQRISWYFHYVFLPLIISAYLLAKLKMDKIYLFTTDEDGLTELQLEQLEQLAMQNKLDDQTLINAVQWLGKRERRKICHGTDEKRCASRKSPGIEMDLNILLPSKKIVFCLIPKNSHSVIRALLCYLADPAAYLKAYANKEPFDMLYKDDMCQRQQHSYDSMAKVVQMIGAQTMSEVLKQWHLMAIVRDPIEKFVSGFVNKCIEQPIPFDIGLPLNASYCNGCKGNFRCFVVTEYVRIMKYYRNENTSWTIEDMHWFPQSWRCSFDTLKGAYRIIKYKSLDDHLSLSRFSNQFIELINNTKGLTMDEIAFIRSQLQWRSPHSTAGAERHKNFKRILMDCPVLMELVIRIYYWDFKMFNFPIPNSKNKKL